MKATYPVFRIKGNGEDELKWVPGAVNSEARREKEKEGYVGEKGMGMSDMKMEAETESASLD